MLKASHIAVIGNANLDIVGGILPEWPVKGTETFLDRADSRIGGSAANTSLVLRRLGTRSGLIAAAGTDAVGDMIIEAFDGDLDRITRVAGPTSITFGVLHPGAERTFFSTPGHLYHFDSAQLQSGLQDWPLDGALALVSGAFALPALTADCERLIRDLRASGALVAIDPGWPGDGWSVDSQSLMRDWIALSSVVLINDKELLGLTGTQTMEDGLVQIAPHLLRDTTLVVKCGPKGAVALQNNTRVAAQSPQADIFDTIGAGDAFNAGYLAAAQAGHDLPACLTAGCRVASAVIRDFPRATSPLDKALLKQSEDTT